MQLRASSTIHHQYRYEGYLKFSSGEKLFLTSHANKSKTLNKLNQINQALQTRIVDLTGEVQAAV